MLMCCITFHHRVNGLVQTVPYSESCFFSDSKLFLPSVHADSKSNQSTVALFVHRQGLRLIDGAESSSPVRTGIAAVQCFFLKHPFRSDCLYTFLIFSYDELFCVMILISHPASQSGPKFWSNLYLMTTRFFCTVSPEIQIVLIIPLYWDSSHNYNLEYYDHDICFDSFIYIRA